MLSNPVSCHHQCLYFRFTGCGYNQSFPCPLYNDNIASGSKIHLFLRFAMPYFGGEGEGGGGRVGMGAEGTALLNTVGSQASVGDTCIAVGQDLYQGIGRNNREKQHKNN
jgi:hypothetical protein